uniref:Uncharacterized protein n=1 Tax=Oryza meridionalis TaxID=40149 RepID=A0A0E0DBV2_9ORYZ
MGKKRGATVTRDLVHVLPFPEADEPRHFSDDGFDGGNPCHRCFFSHILPQSICSWYGLAIGPSVAPLVHVLVWVCFPIAYELLDYVLGKGHATDLFGRAELKTLVTLHGNEVLFAWLFDHCCSSAIHLINSLEWFSFDYL